MKETSVMPLRRRRGREQVDALVARYRQSGLSVVRFCEQERVATSSLYKWLREDRAHVQRATVVEIPWLGGSGQWTLCWPDGRRLLIPYDSPTSSLGSVMRALDGPA